MRSCIFDNNEEIGTENGNSGRNSSKQLDEPLRQSFAQDIVDLRSLMRDKVGRNEIFCSVELVRVEKSKEDIYERFFAETDKFRPLFYALTWNTKTADDDDCRRSSEILKNFPQNTLLHLGGKGLKRDQVHGILKRALAYGKPNIFALQGDSKVPDGDFPHAIDLVTYIRKYFGKKFSICVAGYPQMHPKSLSKHHDLLHLKAKVDAGADFVITQMIFNSDIFIRFVRDCRKIGITVPIIPGIFLIPDYKTLLKVKDLCIVDIPTQLLNDLENIKNDDEAVRHFGVKLTTNIIRDISKSGVTCGFHLFTLNRISLTVSTCAHAGLLRAAPGTLHRQRPFTHAL